ncbi:MAG: 2,3-bisphosphoglycerate-independent phosphoglycerate mutase [Candidatus Yanofskybacteria bacterium]|nr:2,3-bisphosphoglycerate-independent phosphoglycerate mutase [Candidatus Yanofskybacteria bacterium]
MPNDKKTPFILAILDGWGFSNKKIGNPIATANKPTIDMLARLYPMTLLQASGLAVGMTWGESGNSEVGHLNIGAGRIVEQYLSRINRAIKDGTFFTNEALAGAFDSAQKNNSRIHLIGLLTSGTAHSDFSHIIALLELAKQKGYPEVYLHIFSDGKDSGLQESPELLEKLNAEIRTSGIVKIATLIGRNFAMDRDNNWKLTKGAYELLVSAAGERSDDLIATVRKHHSSGRNDSNMSAIVVNNSGFTGISDNDSLIFFNFREDSMRQIVRPFVELNFSLLPVKVFKNIYVCTMTNYLELPVGSLKVHIGFAPPTIVNGLAEVLEINGKKQLHVAETEKYAHTTYFFNGLRSDKYAGEIDIAIESNKDHVHNPEMKSQEIAQKVIDEIDGGIYDIIVLNFANADILAHTGNYDAVVKGVEAIDSALGAIYNSAIIQKDGIMLVTADHGNAESLVYRSSGEAETRHDDNPVPFYLVGRQFQIDKTPEKIAQETSEISGMLSDIAPTVLELLGIPQPEEMSGKSLLGILTGQNS